VARAVLTIEADTSSVVRAMGDLRGVARASQAAMTAEARRGAKDREKAARDEERARRRAEGDALRAKRAAERAATSAANRESRERIAAANREARASSDAARRAMLTARATEREKTRTVEREERQRTRATEREERQRTAMRLREARQAAQVSRAQARAGRDIGIGVRRGLNVGGDAALNVGRVAYSEIRDARRQRAESDNMLNGAFYQAHIGGAEATRMRARIEQEVATGSLRGLSMESVAQGLSAAQTQFNVLGGESAAARAQGMDRQIGLMAFARNTYQDPGEVLRVAGMLQQQGVTGNDQMATIRAMTGMAQAGSIELANVTREALGPLMQNIARSVTAGMTAEQRSRAVQSATLETMAVGEVTARAGGRSRDMLNALSKTRGSITNERTQENLYARLRSQGGAEGQALAAQMFTMQNGRARLNEGTSAVGFLSQLVAGFGGDTNRVSNLLGAGGPGAPMVLDAQQRRLLLLLASQGQGGESIAQNVASMQREGSRFGAADVERGRQMRDAEQLTAIRSSEEQRLRALNDGTSSVVRFSRALDDFVSRNPIGAAAVQSGVGLLGGIVGGAVFPRIGAAIAGTRAGAAIAGVPAATGTAAAGIGLGGLALGAGGALSAIGAARTAITGGQIGGGQASTIDRVNAGLSALSPGAAMGEMARQIGGAIVGALRAQPLTAAIDPHTAAHARSATPTTPR
jgi:hypothetical protein